MTPKFIDLLKEMANRKNAWQYHDGTLIRKDAAAALAEITKMQEQIKNLVSSLECEKRMRKDAEENDERYRWLRKRIPGSAYRIAGVIYSEGGAGVDEAIDAAMVAASKDKP